MTLKVFLLLSSVFTQTGKLSFLFHFSLEVGFDAGANFGALRLPQITNENKGGLNECLFLLFGFFEQNFGTKEQSMSLLYRETTVENVVWISYL